MSIKSIGNNRLDFSKIDYSNAISVKEVIKKTLMEIGRKFMYMNRMQERETMEGIDKALTTYYTDHEYARGLVLLAEVYEKALKVNEKVKLDK